MNYDDINMVCLTDEQQDFVEAEKKKAVKEFVERLKDAYPEGNRDSHMPLISWDDFCYIVDETLEEYLDESYSN